MRNHGGDRTQMWCWTGTGGDMEPEETEASTKEHRRHEGRPGHPGLGVKKPTIYLHDAPSEMPLTLITPNSEPKLGMLSAKVKAPGA